LSDLHLGKSHHFQKHGIPLPGGIQQRTLERLFTLIERTNARRVYLLGDLFHSKYNQEWQYFQGWINELKDLSDSGLEEIRLIKGNHDILPDEIYEQTGLTLCDAWTEGPFSFVHDRSEAEPADQNNNVIDSNEYDLEDFERQTFNSATLRFSGHKHPGIRLKSKGRQTMTLPCFHLTGSDLILPAFGELTGLHLISHQREDEVYAIAEDEVFCIPYSR
jgi:metallophosphoesterase superfamily enzyme